jgi:DnaK suppressor protein
MDSKASSLDPSFLQQQHRRLIELRAQLERAIQTGERAEGDVNGGSLREAQEAEDDAQRLTLLEVDGTLVGRDVAHLAQVKRALQKIEEGTYGFSDSSGEAIPRERLAATPEAIELVSPSVAAG